MSTKIVLVKMFSRTSNRAAMKGKERERSKHKKKKKSFKITFKQNFRPIDPTYICTYVSCICVTINFHVFIRTDYKKRD